MGRASIHDGIAKCVVEDPKSQDRGVVVSR